jgi:hypothetical protein
LNSVMMGNQTLYVRTEFLHTQLAFAWRPSACARMGHIAPNPRSFANRLHKRSNLKLHGSAQQD